MSAARALGVASAAFAAVLALAACSSDSSPSPSPAPGKTASTSPATPAGGGGSLGANCEQYYGSGGCCASLAGDTQAAKDACAQGKKALDQAIANGGTAASYESTCEQAVKAAQSAGKCK